MPTNKKVEAPKKELKKAATTGTAAIEAAKTAKPKGSKSAKAKKTPKTKKLAKAAESAEVGVAQLISSEVVFQGPLFRVLHDKIIEPSGKPNERDVIRHNGSVVILAIDSSKNKKNPWIV